MSIPESSHAGRRSAMRALGRRGGARRRGRRAPGRWPRSGGRRDRRPGRVGRLLEAVATHQRVVEVLSLAPMPPMRRPSSGDSGGSKCLSSGRHDGDGDGQRGGTDRRCRVAQDPCGQMINPMVVEGPIAWRRPGYRRRALRKRRLSRCRQPADRRSRRVARRSLQRCRQRLGARRRVQKHPSGTASGARRPGRGRALILEGGATTDLYGARAPRSSACAVVIRQEPACNLAGAVAGRRQPVATQPEPGGPRARRQAPLLRSTAGSDTSHGHSLTASRTAPRSASAFASALAIGERKVADRRVRPRRPRAGQRHLGPSLFCLGDEALYGLEREGDSGTRVAASA